MSAKLITEDAEAQESALEGQMAWLMSGLDLEKRRMEVRGEVNDVMSSFIIRGLLCMAEMSNEPIELHLSSHGGDAYESFAIADAIMACPCDVNIIASGKIFSAGFVIFLSGDKRTAAPLTTFMMHSVSYDNAGNTKNHEIELNEGKRINNVFLDLVTARSKRPRKFWYRKILSSDCYFDVETATQFGIVNAQRQTTAAGPEKKSKKKVVRKKSAKKGRKK